MAWDRVGDLPPAVAGAWRGKLPPGDIPALYSSAAVVLGTTEVAQRELGMVNNRAFEALVRPLSTCA